jgi:hypothetical protein
VNRLFLRLFAVGFLLAANGAAMGQTKWEPIIEFDNQIFPSLIIATANAKQDTPTYYIGDAFGFIGVALTSPRDNSLLRVAVTVDEIAPFTEYEAVLPKAGKRYEVYPFLKYRYDLLHRINQPFPVNITIKVKIDSEPNATITRRAQVRPLSECLTSYVDKEGKLRSAHWMFSAYVNEDHPAIDGILSEALNTGVVGSFSGYQNGEVQVWEQVFAIWNVLQRRGIRYSSINQTSAQSQKVFSQTVRFITSSVRLQQANCVDGSVLFASILRKIGIDPFLIVTPGHCMVGFYLYPGKRTKVAIETTMLGNENLGRYDEDNSFSGAISRALGYRTKNQVSFASFRSAIAVGLSRAQSVNPAEARSNPLYQQIDIARMREWGIYPIAHQ